MAYIIRKILTIDNNEIAVIIRTVMPEFGASGQGFAIHDKEVDNIFEAFNQPRSAFYVCEIDGVVVGGGGIAPLTGGDEATCELKKMYFLPEGRSIGLGQKLITACIEAARSYNYTYCYLETFNTMSDAMKLYHKNGFEKIPGPLGNTGHFACDVFYKLKL